LPGLVSTSLSQALTGIVAGNFSDWAGRSLIITGTGKTDCAVLVQAATQPNVANNDFYVDTTATTATTSTTATTTSNGMMIVFSVVLFVACLF